MGNKQKSIKNKNRIVLYNININFMTCEPIYGTRWLTILNEREKKNINIPETQATIYSGGLKKKSLVVEPFLEYCEQLGILRRNIF